ncbi:hypothetical protein CAS74_003636 [Pichia kudriavzevii]|uniref:Uncharacterized protein n=1 Tax=Pichia kudriavzevii TaxID=4909 RepID=A0A1Z8JLQ8_PICKU|nr:hypothetical protein CAS74_003636 [Pichia kudriavzevii]
MAKKVISDEVIIDSDAGLSTDSEAERELEEKAVEFQAPKKYSKQDGKKKPSGFEALGKRDKVWLIKVPKDVDVDAIKEIPAVGKEIEINGKLYGISQEEARSDQFQLLLPEGTGYRTCGVGISKVVDLHEKIRIPEINYSQVVTPRENVEREEGLRMRHFPTGYYIKDYEEAQEPVVPGPNAGSKKRRHSAVKETMMPM